MKLSSPQKKVLQALMTGSTLKSHRYIDGAKIYKLPPLAGPAETVRRRTVEALKNHGLIASNKKFPAAAYLLTENGRQIASQLAGTEGKPLSAKNY